MCVPTCIMSASFCMCGSRRPAFDALDYIDLFCCFASLQTDMVWLSWFDVFVVAVSVSVCVVNRLQATCVVLVCAMRFLICPTGRDLWFLT